MEPLLLSAVLLVFQAPDGAWASEAPIEEAQEAGEHKQTGKERRAARRERRRQRREARRNARGEADGSADENGYIEADPDPESEEETEQNLERGMDKAGSNAQKLGALLKKTLNNSPEDMPMGKSLGQALSGSLGSDGGGSGSSSGGGGGGSNSAPVTAGESHVKQIKIPNVANPDPGNKQDLLAAVRSGFGDSLGATGLKLGADPHGKATIVSNDGSPAGQDQLDTLAQHISKEPVALTKRPDFFKVLARQKFQDLKRDIKQPEPGGEGVFKDVQLTGADRDFAWSQTCGGVGGGCNSYVKRSSYRGGEYVEPEDLGKLWSSVHEGGGDAGTASVSTVEDTRVNAKSIRSRLNVVLGGIKQVFLDTKDSKSGGAGGVSGGGSSVAGVFAGMFDWGAKSDKQVVYTDVQKKDRTVVPGQAELATPVATQLPAEKVPAAGMGLGLAVVGLAALAFKRALG